MLRLGEIFVFLCAVTIAASLGAVLYLLVGLNGPESITVAFAALTALAIYQAVTSRLHNRTDLGAKITDLSHGTTELARHVAEIGRRIAALESRGSKTANDAAEKARAATKPLAAELGELSMLIKQLAENVASHEMKLVGATNFAPGGKPGNEPQPLADTATPETNFVPTTNVASAADEADAAKAPAAEHRQKDMIEVVRTAIEANRVELYLQPIVTLPQRKVRYYEAFTKLRTADDTLLQPSDFIDAAEAGGLMPRIDQMLLFRSAQVVRRLQLKNRDASLFCNLAASTLNDQPIFLDILHFMENNRALAPSIVLEFKQDMLREMGPLETESLAALRKLGFRFCMDQVTDLRIEPRVLAERGVRFIKVRTPFLLGESGANDPDIHISDLSDLLKRHGISLIAERVEAEAQVVDLLDQELRFGQGFLFSQPRPVRPEALQGSPESTHPAAHDAFADARDKLAAGRAAGVAH